MLFAIIITVFAVSTDAYVAGVSVGVYRKVGIWRMLFIASFSFFVPLVALLFTKSVFLDNYRLNFLGGCIFIILGIKGLLPERNVQNLLQTHDEKYPLTSSIMLGLSMSIDAGIGAIALSASAPIVVIALTLMMSHFIFLELGRLTANLLRVTSIFGMFANVLMISIGIFKLV